MNFKKLIKKRIIDLETSETTIAKVIGRSRATISRWISNPQSMQMDDFCILLQALKYTEEEAADIVK